MIYATTCPGYSGKRRFDPSRWQSIKPIELSKCPKCGHEAELGLPYEVFTKSGSERLRLGKCLRRCRLEDKCEPFTVPEADKTVKKPSRVRRKMFPTLLQERRIRRLVEHGISFHQIAIAAGKAKCIIYDWIKSGSTERTISALMEQVEKAEKKLGLVP